MRFLQNWATPREQALKPARSRAGQPSPGQNGAAQDAPASTLSLGMDPDRVPIIVNSFNQPTYLRIMVEQLRALGRENLVVLDQASTYPPLLEYLKELEQSFPVIRLAENKGPHWLFTSGVSLTLPEFFIYTDPDIRFPADMPPTFVADMIRAAEALDATKVGLALDVSQPDTMKPAIINIGGADYTLPGWEQQFWREPVSVDDLQLYRAPVDTTFAIYNRRAFDPHARIYRAHKLFDCMDTPRSYRLAGRFTSIHTPWMIDDPMPYEELMYYIDHRSKLHDY
jgi:glycosyltransferase involved in cell wall biosynthesis